MDMDSTYTDPQALTLTEYTQIIEEIENQPQWRRIADREMDYADGNQLDSELLRMQQQLGIPPAVEDLIGPALLSIQGYEAKTRTDWRVTPNGGTGGADVADALNYKLNESERHSKADSACSAAFRPQIAVGLGWVEVARESDPFKYPHRCTPVHRNEIHWDFNAKEKDLSDARWLRRQRWMHHSRIALAFPEAAELIKTIGVYGPSWWGEQTISSDGGQSTGLRNAHNEARAWTMLEDRWYNPTTKEICLAELWYRRWMPVPVITTGDGRVVEYDEDNMLHNYAVARGVAKLTIANVARVRRSYWLGPHCLDDCPSPYSHRHYPYVPFWGFREDATNVPYGYVRGMIFPQDSLNSGISKLRWGMGVVRTERTKGAVDMTDAQLRKQVARRDADIILDADHMARPGARFEVKRDYQLTDQHFQMIEQNRGAIQRVSAVTAGFMGEKGTATSGVQEQTQVEQANQGLGHIMDNFRDSRSMVGELLLSLIIDDLGDKQHVILIEGDAVREDRSVIINKPEVDLDTGVAYLSNDLQRTRLQVGLEDVPSTSTYRAQQLNSMSEAVKALPSQYQAAMMPFMVSLMDVPFKEDVVAAIKAASAQESPQAIEQRIKQAVQEALAKAGNDLKARELDMKERLTDAQVKHIMAEAVATGVQAAFSAMQGGAQVAQMPMIAPIADAIMQGAGYQRPNPMGDDPNFPVAAQTAAMNIKSPYIQGQGADPAAAEAAAAPPVHQNTSPEFPPIPSHGASPMTGIETARTSDNLAGAPA